MLHERDNPARHEPAGSHGRAATGHLGDLNHAACGRHLETAAILRSGNLEGLHALAGVDDDFDAIALHTRTIAHADPLAWQAQPKADDPAR